MSEQRECLKDAKKLIDPFFYYLYYHHSERSEGLVSLRPG
jgi:hypothetical protein